MTQQICAADLDDIDGSEEMIDAFRSMAAYIDYDNGVKTSVSTVDSVVEQDLDATLFAAPDGYTLRDPFSR